MHAMRNFSFPVMATDDIDMRCAIRMNNYEYYYARKFHPNIKYANFTIVHSMELWCVSDSDIDSARVNVVNWKTRLSNANRRQTRTTHTNEDRYHDIGNNSINSTSMHSNIQIH